MSIYKDLDRAIVTAVRLGSSPLYNRSVSAEARRVMGSREEMRVIDGRLQALRKQGAIRFQRGKGACWVIVTNSSPLPSTQPTTKD